MTSVETNGKPLTQYRVALWRSKMSQWYEKEYPVEAHDAQEAAVMAMQQHNATAMGVVIVLSATGQETFDDVHLAGDTLTYGKLSTNPRFALLPPFDYLKPSGSLARAISNVRLTLDTQWDSGRLIDVINHLPPGAYLTATEDFIPVVGQAVGISILQACSLIIDAGFQDRYAELALSHNTVDIEYDDGWISTFVVQYEEQ